MRDFCVCIQRHNRCHKNALFPINPFPNRKWRQRQHIVSSSSTCGQIISRKVCSCHYSFRCDWFDCSPNENIRQAKRARMRPMVVESIGAAISRGVSSERAEVSSSVEEVSLHKHALAALPRLVRTVHVHSIATMANGRQSAARATTVQCRSAN